MNPMNASTFTTLTASSPVGNPTPAIRCTSTTMPRRANASTSFAAATDTIPRPKRVPSRFRSIRMRTLTGRAVTDIAVPRNREPTKSIPSPWARAYPRPNGKTNSVAATMYVRSRRACRSPSAPTSSPAERTRNRIPRVTTTPRAAPSAAVGSGFTHASTAGPRRTPVITSPIKGACPARRHTSPARRVASRSKRRRTRNSIGGLTRHGGSPYLAVFGSQSRRESAPPIGRRDSRVRRPRGRCDPAGLQDLRECRQALDHEVRPRVFQLDRVRLPVLRVADEGGECANRLAREHVVGPVPDHPRVPRTHAEILARRQEQAGFRLPARAPVLQIVRTVVDVLERRAGGGELADYLRVDTPQRSFGQQAPGDRVLVRDHRQPVAHRPQRT